MAKVREEIRAAHGIEVRPRKGAVIVFVLKLKSEGTGN